MLLCAAIEKGKEMSDKRPLALALTAVLIVSGVIGYWMGQGAREWELTRNRQKSVFSSASASSNKSDVTGSTSPRTSTGLESLPLAKEVPAPRGGTTYVFKPGDGKTVPLQGKGVTVTEDVRTLDCHPGCDVYQQIFLKSAPAGHEFVGAFVDPKVRADCEALGGRIVPNMAAPLEKTEKGYRRPNICVK